MSIVSQRVGYNLVTFTFTFHETGPRAEQEVGGKTDTNDKRSNSTKTFLLKFQFNVKLLITISLSHFLFSV